MDVLGTSRVRRTQGERVDRRKRDAMVVTAADPTAGKNRFLTQYVRERGVWAGGTSGLLTFVNAIACAHDARRNAESRGMFLIHSFCPYTES